ncbi:MAG: hypothetical protein Kow006_08580 [Gammaproteobacteria bacterium]
MKPRTEVAMRELIGQVRQKFPFDDPRAQECPESCQGCTPKLLEYLDTELAEWEQRLDSGERPTLGDLHRLGKTCRKIHAVLQKNGLA